MDPNTIRVIIIDDHKVHPLSNLMQMYNCFVSIIFLDLATEEGTATKLVRGNMNAES